MGWDETAILEAVGATRAGVTGGRLHTIARAIGVGQHRHRALSAYLVRLERQGKIVRHPRYTFDNSIFWTLPAAPESASA